MIYKILVLVVLINCKIVAITSASLSKESAMKQKSTTEGPDAIIISDQILTDGPPLNKKNFSIKIESGSTEAVVKLRSTTEGPEAIIKPNQISTEAPPLNESSITNTDSAKLDDIEILLKGIFQITTEAPKTTTDKFDSKETKTHDQVGEVSLDRRTNFIVGANCRCVVRNHCVKTNSCSKSHRKK